MNVNDRGHKKWTSLMLPEHKERLTELAQEQGKIQRPMIDEQKQEDMNYLLNQATQHQLEIELHTYNDGEIKITAGKIKKYSPIERRLTLIDEAGNQHTYFMPSIIDIRPT
jgi:putative heme degradation protein